MISDDFTKKLLALHEQLRDKHQASRENKTIHILGRAAKVTEENGELMDEILSYLGFQRQNKLDKYEHDNLEKEYADLLLTVYLLGLALDIDIEKVVTARLNEKYDEHVGKM